MTQERRIPRAPKGLREAGKRLWRRVLGEFEMSEHEEMLLLQARRIVDVLDRLQNTIDDGQLIVTSTQGPRVHPAVVELRQQALALARVMSALRVPQGDEDEIPTARQVPRRLRAESAA